MLNNHGYAATYGIAVLVLTGCFVLLVAPSQVPSEQLLPFVTGIIGLVLGWVFNRESTAASARSTERSIAQGASSSERSVALGASTSTGTQS